MHIWLNHEVSEGKCMDIITGRGDVLFELFVKLTFNISYFIVPFYSSVYISLHLFARNERVKPTGQ